MKNRKNRNMNLLILGLSILAIAAVIAVIWLGRSEESQEASGESGPDDNQTYITYNGEKYVYNGNLKTMLFMGVDKNETASVQEVTGRSGQTDCLLLMILNQQEKTIKMLEISRDTMADIDIYGMEGDYLETRKAQIATQYAYGKGEKDSCRLTAEAVSKLLYGIPIHDYLALNMAGIAPVVDAVGGVEITFTQDETAVSPEYQKDTTAVLNGEQAEKFIRYRDTEVTGSNTDRMRRQSEFIQALFSKVSKSEDGGLDLVKSFWNAGQEYLTSSMNLNTLEKLSTYTVDQELLNIDGEVLAGEDHDEFHPDEEALQKMIIHIFYEKL